MNRVVDVKDKSWTFWAIMIFLMMYLIISPFYRGLFNGYQSAFDGVIYSALVWTALVQIIYAVHLYLRGLLESQRDVISIIAWFIPLSYLISSFGAASSHLASNELYIRVLWVVFFMIGAYFASSFIGSRIIQYALVGSGYVLVIFGLLNWFGNVSYKDAVLGNRLSSVFQYPNAYAAYLIAILLSTIILVNFTKRWYYKLIPSIMLVPILISLLLTLSRGALLILPIIYILYMITIPWYKQLFTSTYLLLSGTVSLIIYSRMTGIRNELSVEESSNSSLIGWLLLIGTSIVVAGLIIVLNRYIYKTLDHKYSNKKRYSWSNVIFPLLIVIGSVGGYLILTNSTVLLEKLPAEIRVRVESVNSDSTSVFSRNTFYSDSMKIVGEYPFFGAGGGAWSTLYESHKSYPYISAQAHNFYMQYLVEAGWVGISILVLLILYILGMFVKSTISNEKGNYDESRMIFPMFSIVILIHSIIDFDMSFVYLSSIVFLSLGATISHLNKPSAAIQKLWSKNVSRNIAKGYSVIILVVAIILLYQSISADRADVYYKEAKEKLASTENYNEFIIPMNKAIDLQPLHPEYNLLHAEILLQLYKQTQEEKYLNDIKYLLNKIDTKEPYNQMLFELRYALLYETQQFEQALTFAESNITRFPWKIVWYERAITLSVQLGIQAGNNQSLEVRAQYFENARSVADRVIKGTEYIRTLPEIEQNESFNVHNFWINDTIQSQLSLMASVKGSEN